MAYLLPWDLETEDGSETLGWRRFKVHVPVGQHLFDTMCPTAFLAPTLTAKTCLSALSHKMHFFWPSLRCKVIEQMVKSRYLVEFPAQKKEPKWFQNLGRFKKNSSCSVAKKSPKNWTGPCLSLNMVRRKKVHQVANAIAKCQIFVSRCEPNAAQPNAAVATACQNDDRITYSTYSDLKVTLRWP